MSETTMSCREYRDALTASTLTGEPGAGLRAHLADCTACRAEFERLTSLAAAIDQGVTEMVSGEPAPGFAARVRARVEEESAQRGAWWRGWVPAFAGAVAVVALGAWLVWSGAQSPADPGVPRIARDSAPTAPKESEAPPMAPAPEPQPKPVERAAAPIHRQPVRVMTAPATQANTPALPEVLVAENSWGDILRLYDLSEKGQVDAAELAPPDTAPLDSKVQPLTIARLEIKPLQPPQ